MSRNTVERTVIKIIPRDNRQAARPPFSDRRRQAAKLFFNFKPPGVQIIVKETNNGLIFKQDPASWRLRSLNGVLASFLGVLMLFPNAIS
jgi:hypothetical protein